MVFCRSIRMCAHLFVIMIMMMMMMIVIVIVTTDALLIETTIDELC